MKNKENDKVVQNAAKQRQEEKDREEYLKVLGTANEHIRDDTSNYLKYLLMYSSVALGYSVNLTISSKEVFEKVYNAMLFIKISWVLFTLSALFTILTFYLYIQGTKKNLKNYEAGYLNQECSQNNYYTTISEVLEKTIFVLIVVATICFMWAIFLVY